MPLPNAEYLRVFAEYVTLQQAPSNAICKLDWIVGGGLFELRSLICLRARQNYGVHFLLRLSFAQKLVISTQPLSTSVS